MQAKARAKYLRISPTKVRLEADLIRGRQVNEALHILRYSNRKSSLYLINLLKSAVANAETKEDFQDRDSLVIKELFVDGGPMMKRIQTRAMGRAYRIRKRTSMITVVLDDAVAPKRR
jgi:large subunit ribosomal protein L22